MADQVFTAFLHHALIDAMELADESDHLRVIPVPPLPASRFFCEFALPYLQRLPSEVVAVAPGPVLAGIHFPPDYLSSGDQRLGMMVASVLTPDIVHPNISGAGMVCLGTSLWPGTPIRDILWHLHEVLAYRVMSLDEGNALNPTACRLLREHADLLGGLEYRPLRRRRRPFTVTVEP